MRFNSVKFNLSLMMCFSFVTSLVKMKLDLCQFFPKAKCLISCVMCSFEKYPKQLKTVTQLNLDNSI